MLGTELTIANDWAMIALMVVMIGLIAYIHHLLDDRSILRARNKDLSRTNDYLRKLGFGRLVNDAEAEAQLRESFEQWRDTRGRRPLQSHPERITHFDRLLHKHPAAAEEPLLEAIADLAATVLRHYNPAEYAELRRRIEHLRALLEDDLADPAEAAQALLDIDDAIRQAHKHPAAAEASQEVAV